MWWIATNGPTFQSAEAALEDWMTDHNDLPSKVFIGRNGKSRRVITEGSMILDRIVAGIRYTLA